MNKTYNKKYNFTIGTRVGVSDTGKIKLEVSVKDQMNMTINLKVSESKTSKKKFIAVSAIIINSRGKIIDKYTDTIDNISINSRTGKLTQLRSGKGLKEVYAHIIALKSKYSCKTISVWGMTSKKLWINICSVCRLKGRITEFPKTLTNLRVITLNINPDISKMSLQDACKKYEITRKRGFNCIDIATYGHRLYMTVCVQSLTA